MSEFVVLKVAAAKLNRSVARTRQYITNGDFGDEGVGWRRNKMGNLEIGVDALVAFTPPVRGNARAAGIQSATTLRHFRASKTWMLKNAKESDQRRVWLEVTDRAIAALAKKAAAEKAAAADLSPETPAEVEEDTRVAESEEDFSDMVLDL